MTTNTASFLKEANITNTLFLYVSIMLSALALLTFIIAIYEEMGGRQTLARGLSFSLMIVGNAMVTITQDTLYNGIGLALYVGGTTLLILTHQDYTSGLMEQGLHALLGNQSLHLLVCGSRQVFASLFQ